MRRSVLPALAFLLTLLIGPAANAQVSYALADGGSATANDVRLAFGWSPSEIQDRASSVAFSVVGTIDVDLTCWKDLPNGKTLEKDRSTETPVAETVLATLTYAGPNVSGFTFASVAVPSVSTTCPGENGGWYGTADVTSDVDLVASYGGTDVVLKSSVDLD